MIFLRVRMDIDNYYGQGLLSIIVILVQGSFINNNPLKVIQKRHTNTKELEYGK